MTGTTSLQATTVNGAASLQATTINGATTALGAVRVQTGATSNATVAAGKPLFVSGVTSAPDLPILEVRHDNLTQGISLGYSTISATGSNPNQDLSLRARGSGTVNFASPLSFSFARSGALVSSSGGGPWGQWSGATFCPPAQYVCGIRLLVEPDQGGGDDTALNDVDIYCCTLGN